MIKLGQKARDKISGFEGIITGRSQWIYCCDQYCLSPTLGADGKLRTATWFEEGRIEVVGDGIRARPVQVEMPCCPDSLPNMPCVVTPVRKEGGSTDG